MQDIYTKCDSSELQPCSQGKSDGIDKELYPIGNYCAKLLRRPRLQAIAARIDHCLVTATTF